MLIREIRVGINTAQQLKYSQTVQGAVSMVYRLKDLGSTVFGSLITLFHGQIFSQDTLDVTDVARGD